MKLTPTQDRILRILREGGVIRARADFSVAEWVAIPADWPQYIVNKRTLAVLAQKGLTLNEPIDTPFGPGLRITVNNTVIPSPAEPHDVNEAGK